MVLQSIVVDFIVYASDVVLIEKGIAYEEG